MKNPSSLSSSSPLSERLNNGCCGRVGPGRNGQERLASSGEASLSESYLTRAVTMRALDRQAAAEHRAWLNKYAEAEREIMLAQEKRLARRQERIAMMRRNLGDSVPEEVLTRVSWPRREMELFVDTLERMLLLGAGSCVARELRRVSTYKIDAARAKLRRPLYYAAENARRRALAEERRKVRRRTTTNLCPTKEAIFDAWQHIKDSHAAVIRFGSLLEDLECYLDNSLRRDEAGVIIGRNPGVKGWLRVHLPALHMRYTTVMRYKAAAKKLRQATELKDPMPASVIVAEDIAVPHLAVVRARALWLEITAGVPNHPTSLVARLDALLDPARIDDANMLAIWREKYESEITERTKYSWWRRRLNVRWKNPKKAMPEGGSGRGGGK